MDSYSIYIPRLYSSWTQKGVIEIMERFSIGLANRVDFTPVHCIPGFRENMNDIWVSAFVHFDFPYIIHDKRNPLYESEQCNNEFWDVVESDKPYRLQISRHEYWICLKNRDPVARTRMNIHQVVENCRHLEGVISSQAHKISRLEQLLCAQERTVRTVLSIMMKKANTQAKGEDEDEDEKDFAKEEEEAQDSQRKQRGLAI